jgi:hypothetical protein
VSFSRSCAKYSGGGWRSTDAVAKAPLAPDGTFHLAAKKVKTVEMGTVKLTIDGTLAGARADGTLRVDTHWACDGPPVTWSARAVDPNAALAPAAPAPVDGVLYGATSQDATVSAPHGFVVKVEDGATVAHAFGSYAARCEGRDRKGAYRELVVYQTILRESPIAAGRWARRFDNRQTAAQKRHHHRWTRTFAWDATFVGSALAGTLVDRSTYAYTTSRPDKGRCTSGTIRFVVAA